MNRDEWLMNRVAFLKGLKSSTEPQQLLVLLAEKPDRSAADNQLLAALIRLEQANDRAAQARLAAAKLIQASKVTTTEAFWRDATVTPWRWGDGDAIHLLSARGAEPSE